MCQASTSAAGLLADETCSVKLRINEEWGFFVHSEVLRPHPMCCSASSPWRFAHYLKASVSKEWSLRQEKHFWQD